MAIVNTTSIKSHRDLSASIPQHGAESPSRLATDFQPISQSSLVTTATPTAIAVPSFTHPGIAYTTSRESCSCPAFTFGHARDAGYRCKHQLRRFPAPRLCEQCHIDIARQSSCFCSDRCRVASQHAACRHEWAEAGSCDFACVKCGAVHSYEQDEALTTAQTRPMFRASDADPVHERQLAITARRACPGYLRLHAAQADTLASYWCACCLPDDCR